MVYALLKYATLPNLFRIKSIRKCVIFLAEG